MPQDFVVVDPRKAQLLAERASAELVVQMTTRVAMAARVLAPGTMTEQIRELPSKGLGLVISEHPATMFVIYKTQPHWIIAKKGKKLRFFWKGEFVYRNKVWHPGNQHPNNFLLKALEAAKF